MVPIMSGFNKVENMMTSLPVFDAFLFFWRSSPYPNVYDFPNLKRKFKAVLGDITKMSPYSFGNFRKLSLYNSFMPI